MRIAFIGTGGIARAHADGLVKRTDLTFAGAHDAAPERAQSFAAQYGGTAYAHLEEMLDAARPDAVWVCLPPHAHGEAELALAARRIPFLVEKPVANSMEVARRVLDALERAGTLAGAAYMTRYRRSVNRVREVLAADPPVLVHGGWIGGTPGVPWWRVKAQSGGQIVEQTTHTFDLVRYLVGEPRLVYAQGARGFVTDLPGYDVEDASTVAIQFESGAVGSLVSCCASGAGGGVHLTLAARKHYVSFTGWEHTAIIRRSSLEEEQIRGEPNVFELEDAAFIQAAQTGDASLLRSPYADAVRTLAFCLAANRSLETGLPVEVAAL
ncbi:MAG: Gfo/Idh/MocA family oxidoreductase [Anaerolineae bacterium]|nr:Gfo/Idh/MocA family oxidoreductase [Anaerolineae bacterium]